MANRARPLERWEILLESNDLKSDLAEIYSHEFFNGFVRHFETKPPLHSLFDGVLATATAYLTGKQKHKIQFDTLGVKSGLHLRRAGITARTLQYSLKQLSKSSFAIAEIHKNMGAHLAAKPGRGLAAYRMADTLNGPSAPLAYIQELAQALSLAINDIYPLPDEDDEAESKTAKSEALNFVEPFNAARADSLTKLPVHYALECAALAFRPIWEQHSEALYARGRYKHERGGYDSKPARALHEIVARIDGQVPESLVGTAIENSRSRP